MRVTRTPPAQQALLLYQSLKGRAWIEAEELDVKDLCTADGVDKFKAWIAERYQEIEVGKIAEALNGFFKKLRRGPNQSVREFNAAFDRSYARLVEIECRLPETARAWAYLSALSLSHSEELAILGSVNNEFVCSRLQPRGSAPREKSTTPVGPEGQDQALGARKQGSCFWKGEQCQCRRGDPRRGT